MEPNERSKPADKNENEKVKDIPAPDAKGTEKVKGGLAGGGDPGQRIR